MSSEGSIEPNPQPPHHRFPKLRNACRVLLHCLRSPRTRSEWLTRLQQGTRHFQRDTFTLPDRFTALFEHCRSSLQTLPKPRILSFGCSTGEEVFTLARYLPHAEITGVDINRWCLRQAQAANHNPRLRFLYSGSPAFASLTGLDAIFCMAVFQRTENRFLDESVIQTGFLFEHFEQEISILDSKLDVGGLLYIDHCDFRFEDTRAASRYEVVQSDVSQRLRERCLFDCSNRLVSRSYTANRIFIKRRAAGVGDEAPPPSQRPSARELLREREQRVNLA